MHATTKIANLEKIRQMIGENQKMFKEAFKKSGHFDENGDLVKFRHRFNKNSNYMSKWDPWKVAKVVKEGCFIPFPCA